MTRYLIIEPDGTIEAHEGKLETKDAQDIVGGDFEMLPSPTDFPVVIVVAEDAKKKGENANWGVTRLIRSRIRPADFVAGRGIVFGNPDHAGEPTDITEEVEQDIREKLAK